MAILHFFENYNSCEPINIGVGEDISIKELALWIAEKTEYRGSIMWDSSKPNGMLRKCMDVEKMRRNNFFPTISLDEGINQVIENYKRKKNQYETTIDA
jgi:GDP-L-fucose synthase